MTKKKKRILLISLFAVLGILVLGFFINLSSDIPESPDDDDRVEEEEQTTVSGRTVTLYLCNSDGATLDQDNYTFEYTLGTRIEARYVISDGYGFDSVILRNESTGEYFVNLDQAYYIFDGTSLEFTIPAEIIPEDISSFSIVLVCMR